MANNSNTIKTRIQLKNDTEVNWNNAVFPADDTAGTKTSGNSSFVPLQGEVIVYSAEKQGDILPAGRTEPRPFSRLKIGDGGTNVASLPFIAAAYADNSATVNNHTVNSDVPQNAVFTDTTVEIIDMIGTVNS